MVCAQVSSRSRDSREQVDAHLVVYSVTDRPSFLFAQSCLQDLRPAKRHNVVILVANKQDLVRNRVIAEEGLISYRNSPTSTAAVAVVDPMQYTASKPQLFRRLGVVPRYFFLSPVHTSNNVEATLSKQQCCRFWQQSRSNVSSTLLPKTATMSKQHSTL